MLAQFKKLAKHTFIYGTGRFAEQAAGFILIPVYVRYLDPERYGQLAIVMICISLLNVFLNMGFSSAFFKYYFNTDDENVRKSIISTAFIFLTFFSIIVCISLFTNRNWISKLIFGTADLFQYFGYVFGICFFTSLSLIPLALLRAKEQSVAFSIISIIKFFLTVGLILFFVVIRKHGVTGVLQGMLGASIMMSIFFIFYMIRHLTVNFSVSTLKELFYFGAPLMPTQLAAWILTMADRFLLKQMASLEAVGIYNLGHKLGFLINVLVVLPFSIAWGPFMFAVSNEDNAKEFYSQLLTYFLLVAGFIALGLSIFANEIVHVIGTPEYQSAYKVVPYIAFAFVIYGMYFILTAGLNVTKKTVYFPFITGFSALCFIGLNFLLIPRFSMIGAALASLVAYFLMAILTYLFSQRHYFIRYEYNRLLKVIIAIAVLMLAASLASDLSDISLFISKTLILFSFPLLLYILKFFKKGESNRIKEIGLRVLTAKKMNL